MLIELMLLGGAGYFLATRNKTKKDTAKSNTIFSGLKNALMGDSRHQQMLTVSPEFSREAQSIQKQIRRTLLISAGAVGTALLTPLSPIFTGITVITLLYLMLPFFRLGWADLKAGRVLTVYIEGIIVFLGMLAMGYFLLCAITGLLADLFLIVIQRTEENSEQQLVNVFTGHPQRVWVKKDGVEIETDFAALHAGDIVVVNAGEVIPADGIIQQGMATIDQHLLTGESRPVERGEGETVFAATLLLSGRIDIRVETAGEDTVAAKIGHVLDNTQHYKDNMMARGREIGDRFIPLTWSMAALTWPLLGPSAALSVLFAAPGQNMVALGPLSVLSYLHILSQQGILVKDGRVLESLREVNTIVFDKTGTLTLESPVVGQIHTLNGYDENTVLRFAAAAEYHQPHPIAKAIVNKAAADGLDVPVPDETAYETGYGIKVKLASRLVRVGSARFMQREEIELPADIQDIQQQAQQQGVSLIYISIGRQLAGILEMHPVVRPEAVEMIQFLKQRGLEVAIISGDHENPTRTLARQLGIDRYFAETLPEHKAELVKQLREEGKFVCFVGDGINDAIALKSSQVSISLKGASTAATDTAQIILMDGTLNHLKPLFQLSDEFEQTMHNNFLTTIIPAAVCIGGVYFFHFRLVASIATFYIGSSAGLTTSLLPLLKHQNRSPDEA